MDFAKLFTYKNCEQFLNYNFRTEVSYDVKDVCHLYLCSAHKKSYQFMAPK